MKFLFLAIFYSLVVQILARQCSNNVCSVETINPIMRKHKEKLISYIAKFRETSINTTSLAEMTSLARRGISDIILNSGKGQSLFSFYGTVSVGTPQKNYSVLFDTGSYQLWLQGTTGNLYACNQSTTCTLTHQSAPVITYVDGTSIQGQFVNDNVSVAGLTVNNLKFEQASKQTSSSGSDDMAGIMGMSFNVDTTQWQQWWSSLVQNNLVDSSVFGYFIDETDAGGGITFGGVDAARYSGSLTWFDVLPVTASNTQVYAYWQSLMTGFKVSTKSVQSSTKIVAVFDTGTSLVILPQDTASSVNSLLGLQQLTNSEPYLWGMLCPSGKIPSLPDVTVQFGGTWFSISASEYIFQSAADNGAIACVSGFAGQDISSGSSGTNEPNAIIGNVFLRKFYTAYDYSNKKIGLADADRTVGLTPNLTSVPNAQGSGNKSSSDNMHTWSVGKLSIIAFCISLVTLL